MTRPTLALPWIAALALLAAGQARAIGFGNPIQQSDACGPIDVADGMNDPTDSFPGAPAAECMKLCKKSASQCRAFTKKSAACAAAIQNGETDTLVENCKIFQAPVDAKVWAANERADGKSQQQTIKTAQSADSASATAGPAPARAPAPNSADYCLRYSFASLSLADGATIHEVSDAMGHANTNLVLSTFWSRAAREASRGVLEAGRADLRLRLDCVLRPPP